MIIPAYSAPCSRILGRYSEYSGVGLMVNRTGIPIYAKYSYSEIRSNERTLNVDMFRHTYAIFSTSEIMFELMAI